jgi:hypothetical protein
MIQAIFNRLSLSIAAEKITVPGNSVLLAIAVNIGLTR